MSYHNVRDKYGRFAPKKRTRAKAKTRTPRKKKEVTILSAFVLDDSASMHSKISATISGFNEVLATGAESAKKNKVTLHERLCKFGVHGGETWSNQVYPLSLLTYKPNQGGTALRDAVGFTIHKLEHDLFSLPKSTIVNVNIFTDGLENDSKVWSRVELQNLIKQKQNEGWMITFIGAGEKEQVQKSAQSIGIFANNTLNYANNSAGTQAAFASVAQARSTYVKQASQGEITTDGFFGK